MENQAIRLRLTREAKKATFYVVKEYRQQGKQPKEVWFKRFCELNHDKDWHNFKPTIENEMRRGKTWSVAYLVILFRVWKSISHHSFEFRGFGPCVDGCAQALNMDFKKIATLADFYEVREKNNSQFLHETIFPEEDTKAFLRNQQRPFQIFNATGISRSDFKDDFESVKQLTRIFKGEFIETSQLSEDCS